MTDLPPLALSVRQPFAWAIIHAGKDIENRSWAPYRQPPYRAQRGRIAIHAAKGMTRAEWDAAALFMRGFIKCTIPIVLARGGIIGSVELVDIVTAHDSPWFEGPYGFVLRDPQPCEFIPARGALGFFRWTPGIGEARADLPPQGSNY